MGIMDYIPQFGDNTQDVSGIPANDTMAQMELQRKLKLAQALQQQAMPEGQMVSGHYVAPSWTQYLANAIGKYQGSKKEQEAMKQYGEYQSAKQNKLADLLAGKETQAPVDYNEAGNMPGMTQTTRTPYSQQEFVSKAVGLMPELAPKLIESQMAQYGKEETPISLGEGGILVNRKGETIASNPKAEKLAKELSPFGKINPSDFTPASLARYAQTGQWTDLQPNAKEMTPYQKEELKLRKAEIGKKDANNFDSETVDMLADQALAGDKSVFSGRGMTGANIGAIRTRMNQKMRDKGWSGSDIAAKNAEFMGTLAGERAIGTKGANIELAGGEFTNIAPMAKQAGDKIARSGLLPFGKVEVMFNEQTNDPNMSAFAAYNNGLINTYARAISPTGVPSVSDKQHARELLLTAKNQPAYNATVDAMTKEIEAAKRSPRQTRENLRGEISGRSSASGLPSQDAIAAELARRQGR